MTHTTSTLKTFALLLLPMAANAHPGHFDGLPIAHAMSHGLSYLVISVGAIVGTVKIVTHIRFLRQAQRKRK